MHGVEFTGSCSTWAHRPAGWQPTPGWRMNDPTLAAALRDGLAAGAVVNLFRREWGAITFVAHGAHRRGRGGAVAGDDRLAPAAGPPLPPCPSYTPYVVTPSPVPTATPKPTPTPKARHNCQRRATERRGDRSGRQPRARQRSTLRWPTARPPRRGRRRRRRNRCHRVPRQPRRRRRARPRRPDRRRRRSPHLSPRRDAAPRRVCGQAASSRVPFSALIAQRCSSMSTTGPWPTSTTTTMRSASRSPPSRTQSRRKVNASGRTRFQMY